MKRKMKGIVFGLAMSALMSVTALAGTTNSGSAGGCTFTGVISYNNNYNGWSTVRTYGSSGAAYVYVKNSTVFAQNGGRNSVTKSQSSDSTVTKDVSVSLNAPDASYYPLTIEGTHIGAANGASWSGNTKYTGTVK